MIGGNAFPFIANDETIHEKFDRDGFALGGMLDRVLNQILEQNEYRRAIAHQMQDGYRLNNLDKHAMFTG